MKHTIFSFLLFALSHTLIAQKAVLNPSFSATNVAYLKIQKVVVSDTATVLDFESKPGMTFRISSKSYLLENSDSGKLALKSAKGIKLDKFITINEQQTKFTLVFPPINPASSLIDFSEGDCDGCFKILNISLLPVSGRKSLNQAFMGDWYTTDGSKTWVLGLYDSIAVYKNQVWKYTYTNKGKKTMLNLLGKGENKTLIAVPDAKSKGIYLIEDSQHKVLLSRNRQGPLASQFDEEYSSSLLKSDSSSYRGFLGAYSPKLGFKTGRISVNNNITSEQESYLITIDEDGSFYSKFPMHYPQQVFVRFPGEAFSVYCEPGKETFQYLDLANADQAQQFMGDCALINEELRASNLIFDYDYDKKLTQIHGFTPGQYREYTLSKGKKDLDALTVYKQKNFLSRKTAAYLEMESKFRAASDLFEYNWQIESAYRKVNKVSDTKKNPQVKAVKLDSAYFDYVRTLPLDNEIAFITESYHSFINRIRFADVARSSYLNLTLPVIAEGLKKEGVIFSAEDEKIIKLVADAEKIVFKDTIASKKEMRNYQK